MPVTFHPSSHPIEPVTDVDTWRLKGPNFLSPPALILHNVAKQYTPASDDVFQSTFPDQASLNGLMPTGNGFVNAVIRAYGHHHALVIRPDDVWLSILTQFSFYVNANAELLRG
jgi:hypothetical protein